jgi:hypothetical protein
MPTDLEPTRSRTPILHRAFAGLILVGVGALAIWIVIGVIKTVFFIAVGVLVVVAVLWALKTLVW